MNSIEVLEALAPVSGITARDIEHQSTTRIEVTPDMVVLRPGGGARILELATQGAKSMAGYIGLPTNLASELSPRTFGQVATELLERKEKYSVLLKDGAVIAFDKPRTHRPLAPERVVQTIDKVLPAPLYQRAIVTDPATVALEVVTATEKAVARGDMVRAGALVRFSPIGTIPPEIQSYVSRLTCTNGAVSMDYLGKYRGGGEGDDIWQWFRESLRQSYGKLAVIVDRWQKMKQERISDKDRALLLEGLIKEAHLTTEAAATVRAMALEHPPANSYDMMNLITYASSHLLTDPRRIQRAQLVAATYDNPATHTKVCPVCRHNR